MHPFQGRPYYIISIASTLRDGETYWTYDRNEVGVNVETGEHRLTTSHLSYGALKPLNIWEYLLQETAEYGMFGQGGFMLNGVPVRNEEEARTVLADILQLDEGDDD